MSGPCGDDIALIVGGSRRASIAESDLIDAAQSASWRDTAIAVCDHHVRDLSSNDNTATARSGASAGSAASRNHRTNARPSG